MSAIAGAATSVDAAAAPVRRALNAMSARMRGAPGKIWSGQGVALGGAASLIGVVESAPYSIVADARLDNRGELLAQLRGDPGASDEELIIAAYEKWGEDCPTRLLGDFAFALWDSRRRALFCARDHLGVKPLVYAVFEAGVYFASESQGVRAMTGVHGTDAARIADFIIGLPPPDQTAWHAGVSRLPPGHTLVFANGRVQVRCYWRPEPAEAATRGDRAEQFRHLLTQAVRSRSADATGVLLSGGLDSSAIALLAAAMAPQTPSFSLVFDDPELRDERVQIERVLACGGFDPTLIDASGVGPLDDFDAVLAEHDGPVLAPGIATSRLLCRVAADAGASALLDGHGGDEVVSHGFGRLQELARAKDWAKVWTNARAEADLYATSRSSVFLKYWTHLGPLRGFFGAAHGLHMRAERALRNASGRTPSAPAWRLWIDPDLARETRIDERWREARAASAGGASEAAHHLAALGAPMRAHALEVLDRIATHAGLAPRYPFFDKRLVEFCISLDSPDKLDNGWSRLILRKAMDGVLPREIQWRRDKFDFTPSLAHALCGRHRDMLDDIFLGDGGLVLDGLADRKALRRAYRRVAARPDAANGADVHALWRCALLALWRRTRTTPTPALLNVAHEPEGVHD